MHLAYVTVLVMSVGPVMSSKLFTTRQHSNIRVGALVTGNPSSYSPIYV